MYIRLLLTVAITITTVYSLEINETCITPNGETATCIPVLNCTVIYEAVKTKTMEPVQFAKKSKCGVYEKKLLVCCGSTAYPKMEGEEEDFFNVDSLLEETSTAVTVSSSTAEPFKDFETTELPDRSICGVVKEQSRIFGGKITKLDEFPWLAALEFESKFNNENKGIQCGGSIINNRYVLTAAHCVLNREVKITKVRLGEWKLSTDPDCDEPDPAIVANQQCAEPVQNFTIDDYTVHPFYNPRNFENDIALLRLDRDITYNDFIRPICLPPVNFPFPVFESNLTVAGWGITEKGEQSDFKKRADLPVRPNGICTLKLKKAVNPNQLCAGGRPGVDSCQGDSGGPLMRTYEDPANQRSNWYLEGVISYGLQCGKPGFPGFYTRVPRFLNWIINTISEQ